MHFMYKSQDLYLLEVFRKFVIHKPSLKFRQMIEIHLWILSRQFQSCFETDANIS